MGTYRYMARELLSAEFEGEDEAPPAVPTRESDIWSYGMTILVSSLLGFIHFSF